MAYVSDLITTLGRTFAAHSDRSLKLNSRFLNSQCIVQIITTRQSEKVLFLSVSLFFGLGSTKHLRVIPPPPSIHENIWKEQRRFRS